MNEVLSASPRRGRVAGLRFARDDVLARRATAGDTAAFAEIFRRYNRELGRYCQAILGSREQAEDALQNTIVAAMKALPGETREITLKPWLYRVAYNESISLLRQRRPAAELDTELVEPGSDLGLRAERRAGLRALLADLETLPERQRGALVMRELSDLSFAEIASTFDFSEGAARQAVYEARGALLEMAEGRDMDCAAIRAQISASDRRVLRGRRLRAHLGECEGCREFEAAIRNRRAEFAQIAPLAPVAAAGILQSVLGTSAAGGGGGLAALGGAAGGTAALKSAAAVVAVVAAGAGTADLAGVVDLNGSGNGAPAANAEPAEGVAAKAGGAPAGTAGAAHDGTSAGLGRGQGGSGGSSSGKPGKSQKQGQGSANGQGHGNGHGNGNGQANGHGNGNSGGSGVGQTGTPPGQAQTPPGQSGSSSAAAQNPNGTPPGQAQTPPGQAQTPPGQAQNSAGAGQTARATPRPSPRPDRSRVVPEVHPDKEVCLAFRHIEGSTTGARSRTRRMNVRKHMIVAAACFGVLFAGVGTAGAAKDDPAKDAKALCVEQKQADAKAFEAMWGKNAMRDCKRAARGEVAEAAKNSAQECKAEEEADPALFAETYGTNGNKKNAFGKCVSQKTDEAVAEEVVDFKNAAKECRAEKEADPSGFAETYGTNGNKKNAFGKCVSSKVAEDDETETDA